MDFQTANIKYCGVEEKGLTINLIDENKKKWTIWKADYKDKTKDSEVYRALQNFRLGDSFGVSFAEKDESFIGKDGKTVNFKRKTIYSILPTIVKPSYSPQSPQTPKTAPGQTLSYKAEEQPKDDEFWEKKAYKQCLWNYWLKSSSGETGQDWMSDVWFIFNEINKDADKRFAKGWDKAVAVYGADEEIPLPNEIPDSVDDIASQIPF